MNKPKQWWAPVWTGLVMDPSGTHCRRMNNAVWLWLYCVLNANRGTGVLIRKIDTIAADIGVPRRTVSRWITALRSNGYIDAETTGRYLVIRIRKWKLRDGSNLASLVRQNRHTRRAKSGASERHPEQPIPASLSDQSVSDAISNDRKLTREILKIDIDRTYFSENGIALTPREALLADDLAEALNDRPALPFYRSVVQRVPESVLRTILGEVREIPVGKIKTSRGALFNFLVRQYLDRRDS